MNLIDYIRNHEAWSIRTFGNGVRTKGLTAHIRKELIEIEAKPHDVEEWADVVILALDGAWRAGYSAEEICDALEAKQAKNFKRNYPMPTSEDLPSEHNRSGETNSDKINCIWHKGSPSKCYGEEWFIALLNNGDRVVLRSLPEEFSYDYTTADETYYKKERIEKWMQFPDSHFVDFDKGMPEPSTEVTCPVCGNYLPGHATGGSDICDCKP